LKKRFGGGLRLDKISGQTGVKADGGINLRVLGSELESLMIGIRINTGHNYGVDSGLSGEREIVICLRK